MASTNIFYRLPYKKGTNIVTFTGTDCTLDQFCDYLIAKEDLGTGFSLATGTKIFRPASCNLQSISLKNDAHIDVIIPVLGGKGGFGSLLRAIGAQIEKTTNRDACRDLSGRRLRDIKREDELRKLIALQEKLKEERKRRRKEKIEKLKQKQESSTKKAPIQELIALFNDEAYNKRRLELSDILEMAVEKGIINFEKRQKELPKKKEKPKETKTKNLWLGLEDEDEDGNEDEDSGEEDGCNNRELA